MFDRLTFTRFRVAFKVLERGAFPADKHGIFCRGLLADLHDASCGQAPGLCPLGSGTLPFVFSPPLDTRTWCFVGDALNATLVLVGAAAEHAACYIHALDLHARRGLGPDRCRVLVEQVDWLDPRDRKWTQFYFSKERQLRSRPVAFRWTDVLGRAALLSGRRQINLHFETPLRFALDAAGKMDAPHLLTALHRRVASLVQRWCRVEGPGEAPAAEGLPSDAQTPGLAARDGLELVDGLAWKSRPRRTAEGTGTVTLGGSLEAWYPLLVAGQHLHFGAGAAMGYGRYELRA